MITKEDAENAAIAPKDGPQSFFSIARWAVNEMERENADLRKRLDNIDTLYSDAVQDYRAGIEKIDALRSAIESAISDLRAGVSRHAVCERLQNVLEK